MLAAERAKILVVESNERTLGYFTRLLSAQYTVVPAQTLERGQELLQQHDFAAVLAGDTLPWLGCVDFLQHVQATAPYACRIVLGTTPKTDQMIVGINSARIHHYVTKPWRNCAITNILEDEIISANNARQRDQETQHLRTQLRDSQQDLPVRAIMQQQITEHLRTTGCMGVIWFNINSYRRHVEAVSAEQRATIAERLGAFVKRVSKTLVRDSDIVTLEEVGSSRLCVFLRGPRDARLSNHHDVERAATRLRQAFEAEVAHCVPPALATLAPEVGWAHTVFDPHLSPVVQIVGLIDQARAMSQAPQRKDGAPSHATELHRIIHERCIRSLYQPIIALANNDVMGFEALSRGPAGSQFESPEYLLNAADAVGLTMEMDRTFRSLALTNAVTLPRNTKIFVNTLASATHDPDLAATTLQEFLRQLDIAPERVVLEFSERCNVSHHGPWATTLESYRALGLQLAIDDVGTGYSSLERIVSLHPDYIKIDRTLVQGVHTSEVKRSVMQAMMGLAHALSAKVIAEGIEHPEEVACLRDLGVHYGQGHLFGRPAHPSPRSWTMMPTL